MADRDEELDPFTQSSDRSDNEPVTGGDMEHGDATQPSQPRREGGPNTPRDVRDQRVEAEGEGTRSRNQTETGNGSAKPSRRAASRPSGDGHPSTQTGTRKSGQRPTQGASAGIDGADPLDSDALDPIDFSDEGNGIGASNDGVLTGDSAEEVAERVDASQDYIRIKPVREELNSETITRELYGLHEYGTGRKLPLDLEQDLGFVQGVSNFEFIIYKPADEPQFQFYFGPGEKGDITTERLESVTRSQYPENYEFEQESFDITQVFDDVPEMVRYEGKEERRKDWMTTMTTFDTEQSERSPLANLLETAIQSDGAVLFQVVFEPRRDWSRKAQRQKGLLKQGVHTQAGLVLQAAWDAVFGSSDQERRQRHRSDTPQDIGGTIHDTQVDGQRSGTSRMGQIDLKDPSHTYNVTIRAAAEEQRTAQALQDSLNHLSGKFYSITGNYLGQNKSEYQRMLNHGITYPTGIGIFSRKKPMLVCNVDELASYITVPSIDMLPKASRGGSGGRPAAQAPLTSPNEEVFNKFGRGMTIGHAVTAVHEDDPETDMITTIESKREWFAELERRDAIALSAEDLRHHYIRAATTGAGKTVGTMNDMLTAHHSLKGPVILIDSKDGEMCENYLRAHRALFDDLNNVEYIKIPEQNGEVPGMPFFDIRPLVEAGGRDRDTAVQDIIDHYYELLYFTLGRDKVEQAFVANEILQNLIKAMFDEEYGSDYFSIGELLEAGINYQKYGRQVDSVRDVEYEDGSDDGPSTRELIQKAIPKTSNPQVRNNLISHLEKDQRQFINTTDAVLNRIREFSKREFIWDMLSFTVDDEDWDDSAGWYDHSNVHMFDLKHILNSNKVILVDTGELVDESSRLFTFLFLSQLWTASSTIWTPDDDEYIANVIIEEAANIARSKIVYQDLLPQGREFNLSLGLIMQYPEQVLGDNPEQNRTAYNEILNNVNTKLIGNISTDNELAGSLFHEDLDEEEVQDRIAGLRRGEWVVQLPSTGFGEHKPEILTLEPLPIPPGHKDSGFTINSKADQVRARSRRKHCVSRDNDSINLVNVHGGLFADGEDNSDSGDGSDGDNQDTDANEKASEENADSDSDASSPISDGAEDLLKEIYDCWNDDHDLYTFDESMRELRFSEHAEELLHGDLIEKETIGQNNRVYYYPTKDAEAVINDEYLPLNSGEKGDESIRHEYVVRLAKEYYEDLGYDVETYAQIDGEDALYDVVAKPTTDSEDDRPKLVEGENSEDKKGHVEQDYENLSVQGYDSVWAVVGQEEASTLLDSLSDKIDRPKKSLRNPVEFNKKLDSEGCDRVLTVQMMRDRLA